MTTRRTVQTFSDGPGAGARYIAISLKSAAQRDYCLANGLERPRAWTSRATRYGLTLENLHERYRAQGGTCYLCRSAKLRTDLSNAVIDHNHACCPEPPCCGRCVRGIACPLCNALIARVRDDPARIRHIANGRAIPPAGIFGILPGNPTLRRIAKNLDRANAQTLPGA